LMLMNRLVAKKKTNDRQMEFVSDNQKDHEQASKQSERDPEHT